ncbi:hypothetical protein BN2476_230380 [Paraburkholderia piptadeniae]|uniref:AAA+ ATPase domain-containing protein n=1 Tax=Paraburkholderia piptadeniae TaxID=1701573 RepID=A0A1N7RYF3_9BURK|nr:AAA family ATPase [Paraburkholderia piptadeniae]SIT40089.1 hypothetical protein BN2476_230380 [Paraburkholderia piptadeniae]
MPIQQFHVRGLHGLIDARVDFNDDLTVIVGMNGSGKTSILTMMSDMLRFDVARLLDTQFESASLLFLLSDGKRSRLTLDRDNDGGILVALGRDGEPMYETRIFGTPSTADILSSMSVQHSFLRSPSEIALGAHQLGPFMRPMGFEQSGLVKDAMAALPLTFLRVDRTLSASDSSGGVSIEDSGVKASVTRRGQRVEDPIDVVLRITTRLYTEYKDRLEKIRTTSYEKIMSLSFSDDLFLSNAKNVSVADLEKNLSRLQVRVKTSPIRPKDPEFEGTVDKYFADTKVLLDIFRSVSIGAKEVNNEKINLLEALLISRQTRVSELLNIFNTERRRTEEAYAKIKIYLKTLNLFMADSGKRLAFDNRTNTLGFALVKQDTGSNQDHSEEKLRSIKTLSSGERQILIALTYLCFLTKSPGIFVIDEPELSLHLAWQQQLADGLNAVKPAGCQIVLATHTPEIVGRAPDKVVVLEPQYQDGPEADL